MKLSLVTRLISFRPSELFSRSLRTRKLLKNVDVIRMLRLAYLYGELHQSAEFLNPPEAGEFTFDKTLDELTK